jgi:hypothetical protein
VSIVQKAGWAADVIWMLWRLGALFFIYIMTCFEIHVSEEAFLGQPVWKFLGNRFVEAHIRRKAQATEIEI